ncbi:MAG: AlpA family phage regulatory protein [Undibacterium sp.]|nr:AlpA family phage regulatory protein [Undibacterium sp.]
MTQLLTVKQVANKLSMGVSTVWAKSKNLAFPQPFSMGSQTRWKEADVLTYIQNLLPLRDQKYN